METRGKRGSVFIVALFACLMFCGAANAGNGSLPNSRVPALTIWITSQTHDPVRYEMGLMIARAWKDLGFKVKITAMEWATMSSKGMIAHEHDAFIIQWGGRAVRNDPFHWLYTLHHSSEDRPGGYNIAGYRNPVFDRIVEKFVTTNRMSERRKFAFLAQAILARDVPQPPLVHRVITHVYNQRDFSHPVFAVGEGLNSIWNWLSITPRGERKVIRFGNISDIKLLNPLSTRTGVDIYILEMIYDSLVRIDAQGKVKNWAAESVKLINETTIRVTLREGLLFHDGRPVTAEDVKYTFDLAKRVRSPCVFSKIKMLKNVRILDRRTLLFTLSTPFSPFISNSLGSIGILPKHIWKKRYDTHGSEGVLKWDNPRPIGSGPFRFEYWRANEELKLSRFANHFHPPKIEGFIRVPYAKVYGVVQGLQVGEIDSTGWSLLPLEQRLLKPIKRLKMGKIDDQGYYMLHYNTRKRPLDDVRIRRALTYAIPKKRIVKLVFEGQAVPAYSVVGAVNSVWHNPNIEIVGDDGKKARRILREAGFHWDESGRLCYPTKYTLKPFSD